MGTDGRQAEPVLFAGGAEVGGAEVGGTVVEDRVGVPGRSSDVVGAVASDGAEAGAEGSVAPVEGLGPVVGGGTSHGPLVAVGDVPGPVTIGAHPKLR